MLTSKQENFAKAIALKEMNYSDAYRDAYNTKNMKDETIYDHSCKLAKKDKVRIRIKELKEEIDTKTIDNIVITKIKLLEELESIKQNSFDKDNKIAIDCIKEQGKLEGFYVDKIDMKGRIDVIQGLRDFKNRNKEIEE